MHYTLCDMFSDLTQNSFEAGASLITIDFAETETELSVTIGDNGRGMKPDQLKRATDPFYTDGVKHPNRKVGLGIPFLIQTAESCGGSWSLKSHPVSDGGERHGTVLECRFDMTNIDTPPAGDVAGFFAQVLTFDGPYEMAITRKKADREYTVRRSELLDAMGLLDAGAFEDAGALSLLRKYLEEQES
jgi:hypothetical protein